MMKEKLQALLLGVNSDFRVYPSGEHWQVYNGSKQACENIVAAFKSAGINYFSLLKYENSGLASVVVKQTDIHDVSMGTIRAKVAEIKAAIEQGTAQGTRFGGGGEGLATPDKKRGA